MQNNDATMAIKTFCLIKQNKFNSYTFCNSQVVSLQPVLDLLRFLTSFCSIYNICLFTVNLFKTGPEN